MTGLDDEERALQAVQRGAQDYLVKGRVDRGLLSGHRTIACEECHHLGLIEQNRLQVKFVLETGQKTQERHGNETPWKTCTKCHWNEVAQGSLTVNKSTGHARHVFMEKLDCKACHSRTVHAFKPDKNACLRCHTQEVLMLKPAHKTTKHCTNCHKPHQWTPSR